MLKILLSSIVCVLFMTQANASLLTDSGTVTTNAISTHEFSVDQPSSSVDIWELSGQDFRITLFDGIGDFFATNDDHAWGTNSGGHHSGQNWLDASLSLTLLEDNYTAVVTAWTNWTNGGIDSFGTNDRSGGYTLNISGDGISEGHGSVPLPGTMALMLLGLSGVGFYSKKLKVTSA